MIHILYMAAGNSRRFGSNKLLYNWNGKPLYRHSLDMIYELIMEEYEQRRVDVSLTVVSQYAEILTYVDSLREQMLRKLRRNHPENFNQRMEDYAAEMDKNTFGARQLVSGVYSPDSDKGASYSVKAGMQEHLALLKPDDYFMFVVADQPFLGKDSIRRMIELCKESVSKEEYFACGCLSYKDRIGNPCLFHSSLAEELMNLQEDEGGKVVLHRHSYRTVEAVREMELKDVDTREDIRQNERFRQIIDLFAIEGEVKEIIPWGNGLINDSFRVHTTAEDYLFQRINSRNYSDIDGMMDNIVKVTGCLNANTYLLKNGRKKDKIRVIPLKDGSSYYKDENGDGWRAYNFIHGAYSIEKATSSFDAYKSGLLLGQFHELLIDYPVDSLHVVMPDFHNAMAYYRKLLAAAEENAFGRRKEVEEELAFFTGHAYLYDLINDQVASGQLPLRVNHNDPKINNIMFDRENEEGLCMVDLDTLMPGPICYDFGDAIRSTMCTGKDKGIDMDYTRVGCDMAFYNSYRNGFLIGLKGLLTEAEIASLPLGAKLIAFENGMRYLTDYLQGDVYFKIRYPKQNLVKARMHIQLAKDMLSKL